MVAAMPFPPHKAAAIRVQNQIETLKNQVKFRLYTLPPGPAYEQANGFEIVRANSLLDTSNYYRYYAWSSKLRADWQLAKLLAKDIKEQKIDLIHAHTPEGLFIATLAQLIAFKRMPVFGDMHGPLMEELVHYRMLPDNKLFKSFFLFLEKIIYRQATYLSATSDGLAEYLKKRVSPNKIMTFYDYLSPENFKTPRYFDYALRSQLSPRSVPLMMYAGTLKDYQGLDVLLKSTAILTQQKIKFRLAVLGDGGLGKEYFMKMAESLKIQQRVIFCGMKPHLEVAKYLNVADILVSSRKKTPVTLGGFVSQLPEYLSTGKLIVATDISGCREMLAGGIGILTKADSPKSLAVGLYAAIKAKNRYLAKRQRILDRARDYSWVNHKKRLILCYQQLAFGKQFSIKRYYHMTVGLKTSILGKAFLKFFGLPALGKKFRLKIFANMISNSQNQTKTALDAGCGTGEAGLIMASRGYSVDAIDRSKASLKLLQQAARQFAFPVNIIKDDLTAFRTSKKYDQIVCLAVIDYLSNPFKLLDLMSNYLKPGGSLIIGFPLENRRIFRPYETIAHAETFSVGFNPEIIKSKLHQRGLKAVEEHRYLPFNLFYYFSKNIYWLSRLGLSYEISLALAYSIFIVPTIILNSLWGNVWGTEIIIKFNKQKNG